MATIFVFDIDQTLIRSSGAGIRSMEQAFHRLYGIESAFAGIDFAGRTDGAILRDCYARQAMHDRLVAEEIERFRVLYFEFLLTEMASSQCEVLPGVVPLLNALAARDDVALGLGTGNFRNSAEIKLRHVGLWDRFLTGGFADDSDDRAELIGAAVSRIREAARLPDAAAWVIGDSPHDVRAAKANGLPIVAVATGYCSADDLRAEGADAVFADLQDTAAFLALTLGTA